MDTLMRLPALPVMCAVILLAACAPVNPTSMPVMPGVVTLTPPAATTAAPPSETPAQVQATEPATGLAEPATASQEPTLTPTAETATPTYIPYLPTPTETLLPPLELPTEQPHAPVLAPWTGLPTYPGDSDAGLLYRVDYDPDIWAQTEGNFGDIVLGHRQISYCTISAWAGRGLPVDWKATHEFRIIGRASFDVSIVTYQDVVKFVSYVGGEGHILTGFQVQFNDQKDKCLQNAEIVLGTLRSFASTPTPTPLIPTGTSTP